MIAKVVLISRKHIIDQIFDYIVPTELEEQIRIGMRILVPFGIYNNLVEALVIKLNNGDYENSMKPLKMISSIVGTNPVCSKELLELCIWMQKKYLCSFYSAFKLIVPPKMSMVIKEWITIDKNCTSEITKKITPTQKKIITAINENDGLIEYTHLAEIINSKSLRRSVQLLLDKGIINISEEPDESIKELIVRMAQLLVSQDEAYVKADELFKKRSHVQANMLLALADNNAMSTAELVSISGSGSNYSSLAKLMENGYVKLYSERKFREVYDKDDIDITKEYLPTDEQKPIIDYINNLTDTNKHEKILIRGVTGSGKTEVFLQTIKKCIEKNKKAIMLVPEIALTPQMVERFVSRFGNKVAVIHSGLSKGERFDQWSKIHNNEIDVVVGARSAVFAPLENLGLIIIDEEHENSYKSEISPRYHAREVAERRAKTNGATLLMASATPCVDSYYKALNGEYKLFEMNKRYNKNKLPDVKIVDMRTELFEYHNFSPISQRLEFEIRKNLESHEKTILFLNRRGYNTFVSCRECGYVCECKNCSIPLTYHINTDTLICHYCGYTSENISVCPECGSSHIKFFGTGTQKIEDEIKSKFPDARILRMDKDTTSKKGSHENILKSFKNDEADILLGTQMVTKGLDFSDVTLVGVLAADSSLGTDDFRANEKTFSLLTQVCGRAGRGNIQGRAIIQTYQPKNATIGFSQNHDYVNFYKNEISFRKRLNYPPFCDIISILVHGEDESKVKTEINSIFNIISSTTAKDDNYLKITPPLPAPINKIKKNYRYRFLLKVKKADNALQLLHKVNRSHNKKPNGNTLIIDINPINLS